MKPIAQIWRVAHNCWVPAVQILLSPVATVAVSTWVGSVTETKTVRRGKMNLTAWTPAERTRSSARTSRAASANTGGAMALVTAKMAVTRTKQSVRRGLAVRILTSSVLKATASPVDGCATVTMTVGERTGRRVQTKTWQSATTSAKKMNSNVPTTDVSSTTSSVTATMTARITAMSRACANTKFVRQTS